MFCREAAELSLIQLINLVGFDGLYEGSKLRVAGADLRP
jgi:hypothetical protein